MTTKLYKETFDDGPGGWYQATGNTTPEAQLQIKNGIVICYGQWWVDYNHAPPGAGYLNLLMCLNTTGPFSESVRDAGGQNKFVAGGFSTDLTNATLSLRVKGELELRGAQLILLIQGNVEGKTTGWLLTGQPIQVGKKWTEQSIKLLPDAKQWTCTGSRHDRTDTYGTSDLKKVLRNVNVNIHIVLFPVNPVPLGPFKGDPHRLRAGRDYPLWRSRLPDGYLMVDTIEIKFP